MENHLPSGSKMKRTISAAKDSSSHAGVGGGEEERGVVRGGTGGGQDTGAEQGDGARWGGGRSQALCSTTRPSSFRGSFFCTRVDWRVVTSWAEPASTIIDKKSWGQSV